MSENCDSCGNFETELVECETINCEAKVCENCHSEWGSCSGCNLVFCNKHLHIKLDLKQYCGLCQEETSEIERDYHCDSCYGANCWQKGLGHYFTEKIKQVNENPNEWSREIMKERIMAGFPLSEEKAEKLVKTLDEKNGTIPCFFCNIDGKNTKNPILGIIMYDSEFWN